MIVVLLLTISFTCDLVCGIEQQKNIPTIYIKGEEDIALNLDDYFIGDEIHYEVSTGDIIKKSEYREVLDTISFTSKKQCTYYSNIILPISERTSPNSYYLVIQCKDNVLIEGEFVYPSTNKKEIKLNVVNDFKDMNNCILMSNTRGQDVDSPEDNTLEAGITWQEIIMRCTGKNQKNYRTFSSKVKERKYVHWIEEIVDNEDIDQETMKFSYQKSGVLSKDRFEEKVYRYKNDSKRGVYAYAEVFTLRDYRLEQPFTDFVITKSYSYLIYRHRCLRIYKQVLYDGVNTLCSDLIFPTDIYKIYYVPEHDSNNIYVYSNTECTIYRVNIRDITWPYIEYVYKPHKPNKSYNINILVTDSSVVCMSSANGKLISYQVYNKFPGTGQALIGLYSTEGLSIRNITLLNYQQDTIVEMKDNKLIVVKLSQRLVVLSTFGKEIGWAKKFPLNITVKGSNKSHEKKVSVDIYVIPSISNETYKNEEKGVEFSGLMNDNLEVDINDYLLMNNITYELKESTNKLKIHMVNKTVEKELETDYNNSTYSECNNKDSFTISMSNGDRLEIREKYFLYHYYLPNTNKEFKRKIKLQQEGAIHCLRDGAKNHYLSKERYFIFLTQVTNKAQYVNVVDLSKQNINNYYMIRELNNSRVVNINEYIFTVDEERNYIINFDILYEYGDTVMHTFELQVSNILHVKLPCSSKETETHSATFTANNKDFTLYFTPHKYNLHLTQLKHNISITHSYKYIYDPVPLNLKEFITGHQVTAFPTINGSYFVYPLSINVAQHITFIKNIKNNEDTYNNIAIIDSKQYPIILLIKDDKNFLHLSFYSNITIDPAINDYSVSRINFDRLTYEILSIGPLIEYEDNEYLILYTNRYFSPHSVKFVDVKRSKLSLREIIFTFGIMGIVYNPSTKHLFLLEQPPIEHFYNKVLLKRMDNLNNFINDFEDFIDFKDLTTNTSTITAMDIDVSKSRLYLGVMNYGIFEFEDTSDKILGMGKLDLANNFSQPFIIFNLKHTTENNISYLFGTTEKEVFVIDTESLKLLAYCLKPSLYKIRNLTAVDGLVYAVVLDIIDPVPRASNYRIIFYKYNVETKELEMKVHSNTKHRPLSIKIISRTETETYIGIGIENGIRIEKVMIDPVVTLTPRLGAKNITIECQNPSGIKNFSIFYNPIEIKDTESSNNIYIYIGLGIGLAVMIGGVIIAILIKKRKAEEDEEHESFIDNRKNS